MRFNLPWSPVASKLRPPAEKSDCHCYPLCPFRQSSLRLRFKKNLDNENIMESWTIFDGDNVRPPPPKQKLTLLSPGFNQKWMDILAHIRFWRVWRVDDALHVGGLGSPGLSQWQMTFVHQATRAEHDQHRTISKKIARIDCMSLNVIHYRYLSTFKHRNPISSWKLSIWAGHFTSSVGEMANTSLPHCPTRKLFWTECMSPTILQMHFGIHMNEHTSPRNPSNSSKLLVLVRVYWRNPSLAALLWESFFCTAWKAKDHKEFAWFASHLALGASVTAATSKCSTKPVRLRTWTANSCMFFHTASVLMLLDWLHKL